MVWCGASVLFPDINVIDAIGAHYTCARCCSSREFGGGGGGGAAFLFGARSLHSSTELLLG